MRNKKWIVALLEVNEDALSGLRAHEELGSLPDVMQHALKNAIPQGLDMKVVYLLNGKQKNHVEQTLEDNSIPYHEYAVDRRGEHCVMEGCEAHAKLAKVLYLN